TTSGGSASRGIGRMPMLRFVSRSIGKMPMPRSRVLRVGGMPMARGFTMMEVMLVLVIMSIVAVLGMDAIAEFEAAQRADRAARESLAFFRLARNLAMTTGKNAKVVVDPSTNKISVFWKGDGTGGSAYP